MCHLKKMSDLKKGDRLVLPSGYYNKQTEVENEVAGEHYIPQEGMEYGTLVFEVKTPVEERTMLSKGIMFDMSLTNIESMATLTAVEDSWGIKRDEELSVFIPETVMDKVVLLLNDTVKFPKPAEKEKDARQIGKEHLHSFSGGKTMEVDGKESRESMRRIRDIRTTLPMLRKTECERHSEFVVLEGGLKPNYCYLDRLATASRDYIEGNATAVGSKWKGINMFRGVGNLRILQNKEAFNNFAILGTWDEDKHGRLMNQFLSVDESPNDDSPTQLATISRNMQTILQIAHGLHWNEVLDPFSKKITDGLVGEVCPAHIKTEMDEAWKACSHSLREDSNVVSLQIDEASKTYRMDSSSDVVEMVKDHFNAIKETSFKALQRFQKAQTEQEATSKAMTTAKKHELKIEETSRAPSKKPRMGEKDTNAPKQPNSVSTRRKAGNTGSKSTDTSKDSQPMLCIFNLKYFLLRTGKDCNKGEACDRQHYSRSLKESNDYHWNEERVTEQIKKARTFIISESDKVKLLEAVKTEFKA